MKVGEREVGVIIVGLRVEERVTVAVAMAVVMRMSEGMSVA